MLAMTVMFPVICEPKILTWLYVAVIDARGVDRQSASRIKLRTCSRAEGEGRSSGAGAAKLHSIDAMESSKIAIRQGEARGGVGKLQRVCPRSTGDGSDVGALDQELIVASAAGERVGGVWRQSP